MGVKISHRNEIQKVEKGTIHRANRSWEGNSTKFYTGKLCLEVQLTDLTLINGPPFTYIVSNFASLLTAANPLTFKYEQSSKPENSTSWQS